MQPMKAKSVPTTVKGAWKAIRRDIKSPGTGRGLREDGFPSLKAFARHHAGSKVRDAIALAAERWLAAKRPGGTDEERKARRTKRRDQQSLRAATKAARKGKGTLKSSGKRKPGGGRDGEH